LAKEGVQALNSEYLSRKLKMSRSHVLYYFPDTEAMIEAAIKFVILVGQEVTVAHLVNHDNSTSRDKLTAYVDSTFSWLEQFPKHASIYTLFHYYSIFDPKFKALHEQVITGSEARIASILLSDSKKKVLTKSIQSISQMIRVVLMGNLITCFGTSREENISKEKRETLKTILDLAAPAWS
jgi:AcrR family transcriptional regulator